MPKIDGTGKELSDAAFDAYSKTRDVIVQQINGGTLNQDVYYYSITFEAPATNPGDGKAVCKVTYDIRVSTVAAGNDAPDAVRTPPKKNPDRITEAGHIGPDLRNAPQPDPPQVFLKCNQYVVANQSRDGANRKEAVSKAFEDALWQALGKQCPAGCADLHVHIWTRYRASTLSNTGPRANWWLKCWCGDEENER